MLKRTLLAAAAAMVMCGAAVAQDGTYHQNVNKNMQDNMQNKSMYGTKSYSDLSNWKNDSTWMTDVWKSINSRDQAVLTQALWRLPSAEEMAVRKALQKCHMGSDAMLTSIRQHSAMSTPGTSMPSEFKMSDKNVWNSALDGLTIYEKRQLDWVWENMLPSERDALMNAFKACHEHHWRMSNSMSRGY